MYRLKGQALEIEARAKMRITDEYEAAQERGDVQKQGGLKQSINPATDGVENDVAPTAADMGITSQEVHEGRALRDAEDEEPGR